MGLELNSQHVQISLDNSDLYEEGMAHSELTIDKMKGFADWTQDNYFKHSKNSLWCGYSKSELYTTDELIDIYLSQEP